MLGEEHTETLETMHDLSLNYLGQGCDQDVKKVFAWLLDIQKKGLGDGHLVPLGTMDNLALHG